MYEPLPKTAPELPPIPKTPPKKKGILDHEIGNFETKSNIEDPTVYDGDKYLGDANVMLLFSTNPLIITGETSGRSVIPNYSMNVKASLYDSNWWIRDSKLQYEDEGEPL